MCCATPPKKNKALKSFAKRSPQASHDVKGIIAGPLAEGGFREKTRNLKRSFKNISKFCSKFQTKFLHP